MKEWLRDLVVTMLIIASIAVVICGLRYVTEPERERGRNVFRAQGRQAHSVGVGAEANPYKGTWGETHNAKLWLDGWIEASKENQ